VLSSPITTCSGYPQCTDSGLCDSSTLSCTCELTLSSSGHHQSVGGCFFHISASLAPFDFKIWRSCIMVLLMHCASIKLESHTDILFNKKQSVTFLCKCTQISSNFHKYALGKSRTLDKMHCIYSSSLMLMQFLYLLASCSTSYNSLTPSPSSIEHYYTPLSLLSCQTLYATATEDCFSPA